MNTPRFETFEGKDGDFWWRFRAANGQIMAGSGEGYSRKGDCKDALLRVRQLMTRNITIVER